MIIVTGGAGFIGSAIVWKLNERGIKDILIVDRLGTGDKWQNLKGLKYREVLHKDIFHEQLLTEGLPEGVEAVFHMGACSSTTEKDADYLISNNTHYSCNIAQECAEKDVRFIYASSAATYGDGSRGYSDDIETIERLRPLSIYGYSKHIFDVWMRNEGLLDNAVGFKFFNVFGVNEYHKGEMRSLALKAWEQIMERGRVKLFANHRSDHIDGDEMRDFVYVKDLAAMSVEALDKRIAGGVYNLGTGKPRSFKDVAVAVYEALGIEPQIDWIAMPAELRDQYQYFTKAEMKKAAAAGFNVPQTTLEDAIRDYVQNYLQQDMAHLDH
jgi:ADP-L-glycero-D-manno-heptose 6-epimerase